VASAFKRRYYDLPSRDTGYSQEKVDQWADPTAALSTPTLPCRTVSEARGAITRKRTRADASMRTIQCEILLPQPLDSSYKPFRSRVESLLVFLHAKIVGPVLIDGLGAG